MARVLVSSVAPARRTLNFAPAMRYSQPSAKQWNFCATTLKRELTSVAATEQSLIATGRRRRAQLSHRRQPARPATPQHALLKERLAPNPPIAICGYVLDCPAMPPDSSLSYMPLCMRVGSCRPIVSDAFGMPVNKYAAMPGPTLQPRQHHAWRARDPQKKGHRAHVRGRTFSAARLDWIARAGGPPAAHVESRLRTDCERTWRCICRETYGRAPALKRRRLLKDPPCVPLVGANCSWGGLRASHPQAPRPSSITRGPSILFSEETAPPRFCPRPRPRSITRWHRGVNCARSLTGHESKPCQPCHAAEAETTRARRHPKDLVENAMRPQTRGARQKPTKLGDEHAVSNCLRRDTIPVGNASDRPADNGVPNRIHPCVRHASGPAAPATASWKCLRLQRRQAVREAACRCARHSGALASA